MNQVRLLPIILLGALLMQIAAISATTAKQKRLVDYSRSKLETPYRFNGRLTTKHPDLDCMGICFRAYALVYGEKWTSYSVIPSRLIKAGQLGSAIDGKAHSYSEDFIRLLQPGDIIYFLVDYPAISDAAVAIEGDKSFWVYHMGLFTEDGKVIHASPWAGKVVEEELALFKDQFHFLITRRSKP
jgi:cell wall-associated NlpC family hydrolase